MRSVKVFRPALIFAAATMLVGCDKGRSACKKVTQAALTKQSGYQEIATREEPGETPAMTYYVIDYIVTATGGRRLREQVHCSYMRDTGEAVPHRVSSAPAN